MAPEPPWTHTRVATRGTIAPMTRIDRSARARARERILDRDGWVCHLCLEPIHADITWPDVMYGVLDHLTPVCDGGKNHPDNLMAAHWACNQWRGNARLESAREARAGWVRY